MSQVSVTHLEKWVFGIAAAIFAGLCLAVISWGISANATLAVINVQLTSLTERVKQGQDDARTERTEIKRSLEKLDDRVGAVERKTPEKRKGD